MGKTRVAVIFGGKSAEHKVSLQSAKNIIEAMDKEKYEVIPISIGTDGKWHIHREKYLKNEDDPKKIGLREEAKGNRTSIVPSGDGAELIGISSYEKLGKIDVVFPVLHGTYGEDGAIQGFLKMADVAFVGPDILGSAISMDKDVMKRLLRDAGLPIGKFLAFGNIDRQNMDFENIKDYLGLPFFVKPANLGSSVGISKVSNREEFDSAIDVAFRYDNKIVLEENIDGREIECSVLGNESPIASIPGEIVPKHDFYSYEAKYLDDKGAELKIPALLTDSQKDDIQKLAVKVFKVLGCEGMGRVDFFLGKDGRIYINEINTIPGFTKISMYPKLWEASGIAYPELIEKLIGYAIKAFERRKGLQTSFLNN